MYKGMLLHLSVICLLLTVSISSSANAQQVHRKLPNTIEYRKLAISHKPFTIDEFRKIRTDITATTTVKLRSGAKLTFSEFLKELNEIEKLLNDYGYSVRDGVKTKKAIVLDETRIQIRGKDAFRKTAGSLQTIPPLRSSAIPSLDGPLQQFEPDEVVFTVLDPAVFGAEMTLRKSSNNNITTIATTDTLEITGWVDNKSSRLFSIGSTANVPTGLAPNDPKRRANIQFNILGLMNKNESAVDSGTNSAVVSYSTPNVSYNSPSLKMETYIGIIPVTLKVGFQVNGAANLTSQAEVYSSLNSVSLSGGVAVTARALADFKIVAGGVQVAIDALKYTYNYTNRSSLTRMPLPTSEVPSPHWDWTSVAWNYGDSYQIESGSGSFSVVIEVDAWIFGSVTYAKNLVPWDGHTWSQGAVESPTQLLTRPAGCGQPLFANAMCTIPATDAGCVSLYEDNNCGGCGVHCSASESCEVGSCIHPRLTPQGHICPTGTYCCEWDPIIKKCRGDCIGPNQSCE